MAGMRSRSFCRFAGEAEGEPANEETETTSSHNGLVEFGKRAKSSGILQGLWPGGILSDLRTPYNTKTPGKTAEHLHHRGQWLYIMDIDFARLQSAQDRSSRLMMRLGRRGR